MQPRDFGGNTGWDEPEPLRSQVSPPSNIQHVTRVTHIGPLSVLSKTFFNTTSKTTYICTLSGDTLTGVPEHTSRRKNNIHYTISNYDRVDFEYDHTVKESSHKRNRIVFHKGVTPITVTSNSSPRSTNSTTTPTKQPSKTATKPTKTILAVPTDKEMARWESSLRSLLSMHGRCFSTLRDNKGRLRPYSRGLHNSAAKLHVVGDSSPTKGSSGGSSTVRVVKVYLPQSLGTLLVRLQQSSLETTVRDVKTMVFRQLSTMQRQLKREHRSILPDDAEVEAGDIGKGGVKERKGEKDMGSNQGEEKGEREKEQEDHIVLERVQFINPLAMLDQLSSAITFETNESQGKNNSRPRNDPSYLPNQVINPFAAMEAMNKEVTTTTTTATTTTVSPSPTYLLPAQILAKKEYATITNLLLRGPK